MLVEAGEGIARCPNDHVHAPGDDDDDGRDRAVSGKVEETDLILKAHCLGQHHAVFVQDDYFAGSSWNFRRRLSYHAHAAACDYAEPGQARLLVLMTWMVAQPSLAARLNGAKVYQSYRSAHMLAKGYSYAEILETNNVLGKYLFQGFLGIDQSMTTVDQTLTCWSRMSYSRR